MSNIKSVSPQNIVSSITTQNMEPVGEVSLFIGLRFLNPQPQAVAYISNGGEDIPLERQPDDLWTASGLSEKDTGSARNTLNAMQFKVKTFNGQELSPIIVWAYVPYAESICTISLIGSMSIPESNS